MGLADVTGTFAAMPLSLLLIRALDARWSGALRVGADTTVQIDRGLVARVLCADGYARLGELLVDAGVVMAAERDLALSEPGPLGSALMRQGLLDHEVLGRALVLQNLNRMSRLFALPPTTSFGFVAGAAIFEGMPPGARIDSLLLLWAGLHAHGEQGERLERTIAAIGDTVVRVRPEAKLSRFGFRGDALALATALCERPATIPAILASGAAPVEVCRLVIYLLAITRYLESAPAESAGEAWDAAGEPPPSAPPSVTAPVSVTATDPTPLAAAPSAPTGADPSAEAPPAARPSGARVVRIQLRQLGLRRSAAPDEAGSGEQSLPSSIQPRDSDAIDPTPLPLAYLEGDTNPSASTAEHIRADVEMRSATLPRETPWGVLEVRRGLLTDGPEEQVRERLWAAYEELAGKWNPRGCPPELSDLRPAMRAMYDRLTDAYAALADPASRREVLARGLAMGSLRILPAALAELALSELAAGFPDRAHHLSVEACGREPEDPDLQAVAIWIRAHLPKPDLSVLTHDLDDLLVLHDKSVAARFYRGVLRSRQGYGAAAKQDLEWVLAVAPDHPGARAELTALIRSVERS